jgi:hypothetical protein
MLGRGSWWTRMFGQVDWTPVQTFPTAEACETQRTDLQLKVGVSIRYRSFPGDIDPRVPR